MAENILWEIAKALEGSREKNKELGRKYNYFRAQVAKTPSLNRA